MTVSGDPEKHIRKGLAECEHQDPAKAGTIQALAGRLLQVDLQPRELALAHARGIIEVFPPRV